MTSLRQPALFTTPLRQNAGREITSFMVVFSRLSNADFQQTGRDAERKTTTAAVFRFYSVPVSSARGASSLDSSSSFKTN